MQTLCAVLTECTPSVPNYSSTSNLERREYMLGAIHVNIEQIEITADLWLRMPGVQCKDNMFDA